MSDGVTDSADLLVELHDLRPEDRRTHELLTEVLAEVRALRADRERLRRPALSRLHRAALSPLLPEINDAVGATFWTGRYLVGYATAKDGHLLRAIEAAVGPCDDGMVRRLGKLLAQADGQIVDGYLVTGSDNGARDGCEWQVLRV